MTPDRKPFFYSPRALATFSLLFGAFNDLVIFSKEINAHESRKSRPAVESYSSRALIVYTIQTADNQGREENFQIAHYSQALFLILMHFFLRSRRAPHAHESVPWTFHRALRCAACTWLRIAARIAISRPHACSHSREKEIRHAALLN